MNAAQKLPAKVRSRLFLYNLFFPFVFLTMLPRLIRRMFKRGNFRKNFGQRFGIYSAKIRERFSAERWTWIHSVSVGETLLALKLIRKMREIDPDLNVALSVTTSTGYAVAVEQRSDWLEVIYNPLDAPMIVGRALDLVRPERLVFIEAIWPNLLAHAKRRGIPALLIARLSPRSEARFRRFQFFTAPLFQLLDRICLQEELDIDRWKTIGARADQLVCLGSIKFDESMASTKRLAEFREILRGHGIPDDASILLAGSTFAGEEKIVARVFQKLRTRFPALFLIIVPRHVERTNEIAAELTRLDLRFALRTGELRGNRPDCLLINTTGELRDWYHFATVVFVGKSLTASGGQNPVEAAVAGKPVIFGPHMENFRDIVAQWLRKDAAIQVIDADELETAVADLLSNPSRCNDLARRAKEIVASHTGATERVARLALGK